MISNNSRVLSSDLLLPKILMARPQSPCPRPRPHNGDTSAREPGIEAMQKMVQGEEDKRLSFFFLHCIVCFLDHCQKMCASWSQVVAKRDGARRQILEKTIITNETLPLFVTTDYIEPFFMSLITIEHLLTVFYSL